MVRGGFPTSNISFGALSSQCMIVEYILDRSNALAHWRLRIDHFLQFVKVLNPKSLKYRLTCSANNSSLLSLTCGAPKICERNGLCALGTVYGVDDGSACRVYYMCAVFMIYQSYSMHPSCRGRTESCSRSRRASAHDTRLRWLMPHQFTK